MPTVRPAISGPAGSLSFIIEGEHSHPHRSYHRLQTSHQVQLPAQVRRVSPHRVRTHFQLGRSQTSENRRIYPEPPAPLDTGGDRRWQPKEHNDKMKYPKKVQPARTHNDDVTNPAESN